MIKTDVYHFAEDGERALVAENWDLALDGFGRFKVPAGTLKAFDNRMLFLSQRPETTTFQDNKEAIADVLPGLDEDDVSERDLRKLGSGYICLRELFIEE